jgi:hypothetical protein
VSATVQRGYPELHRLPLAGEPRDLPAPPAGLVPQAFAARLYAMLAPLAQQDPNAGWSLLIYCNALGTMFELVEDWVRDTAAGPGWSEFLDLQRCPDVALPWLGQFAGVRVLPGSSPAEMRARIASTDGFKRGTVAAMKGAAAATLTGAQAVHIRERSGGPTTSPEYAYHLEVLTYTAQTPDQAATLAALVAQKPGGLVIHYSVADGQNWQEVKDLNADWAAVRSGYVSWGAVMTATPAVTRRRRAA